MSWSAYMTKERSPFWALREAATSVIPLSAPVVFACSVNIYSYWSFFPYCINNLLIFAQRACKYIFLCVKKLKKKWPIIHRERCHCKTYSKNIHLPWSSHPRHYLVSRKAQCISIDKAETSGTRTSSNRPWRQALFGLSISGRWCGLPCDRLLEHLV